MSNTMNKINQSKLNESMSYIFSSNGNNYTFKKLDNMLINMPENDGKHVLVCETVDGVPQYSWTIPSGCFVKVNNATMFEYTHTLNHSIINANSNYLLLYISFSHRFLVTMRIMSYLIIVIPSNRLWVRDTR